MLSGMMGNRAKELIIKSCFMKLEAESMVGSKGPKCRTDKRAAMASNLDG
jgi:hypothetical protein